jgi:hypothetical protein
MITQRFRPVAWVAGVAVATTALYLVSVKVASERGRLQKVDREIAQAHRSIRQLQTELGTRGSLRQLEKWNVEALALTTPKFEQYLSDADQLATMDTSKLKSAAPQSAPMMVASARLQPAEEAQIATPPAAAPILDRTNKVALLDKALLPQPTVEQLPAAKPAQASKKDAKQP